MKEDAPQNNIEAEMAIARQGAIALAMELFENKERFTFPGINPGSYEIIKQGEEEGFGYRTPIDELLKRFEKEGIKVVFVGHSKSGNAFILPQGSNDVVSDSLLPRHLSTEGEIDEKLLRLILVEKQLFVKLNS